MDFLDGLAILFWGVILGLNSLMIHSMEVTIEAGSNITRYFYMRSKMNKKIFYLELVICADY